MVLFINKLSECWCHIINPYLLTKFHTSKHLGKRVTNMHVHIVLCCGAKRVLFTNKLSKYQCRISIPYLFTKFHASKHFGKRVTQTCMPYCNVWVEVVYCGFPKSKVFTKTLISLFSACHQSLYLHQVSYVGVLRLVRFANSTRRRRRRRMNNSEKAFFALSHSQKQPNCSFDGIVIMM